MPPLEEGMGVKEHDSKRRISSFLIADLLDKSVTGWGFCFNFVISIAKKK